MAKMKAKYTHTSVYFKDEDKSLLDALKEEAKKNNLTFSDYTKELIKTGRDTGVYDLPESVSVIDQSGKIKDLENQIQRFKTDIRRLTKLKDDNFDWDAILKILRTDDYITERQILHKLGKINKSLFTDEYNEEHIELMTIDLQQKLCLRVDYYQDVEYKKNQGWKKCKK